jgi:hypothetical protein
MTDDQETINTLLNKLSQSHTAAISDLFFELNKLQKRVEALEEKIDKRNLPQPPLYDDI